MSAETQSVCHCLVALRTTCIAPKDTVDDYSERNGSCVTLFSFFFSSVVSSLKAAWTKQTARENGTKSPRTNPRASSTILACTQRTWFAICVAMVTDVTVSFCQKSPLSIDRELVVFLSINNGLEDLEAVFEAREFAVVVYTTYRH
ncbi:hypothetical protein BaRGS_00039430 [Batillaria attramentaria]|uniref:Uncharacterized protein n=1 Tax=Batillaria attramentaria TaxID=370345 RepID=A0ABD0J3S1_9CAEN